MVRAAYHRDGGGGGGGDRHSGSMYGTKYPAMAGPETVGSGRHEQ